MILTISCVTAFVIFKIGRCEGKKARKHLWFNSKYLYKKYLFLGVMSLVNTGLKGKKSIQELM